MGMKTACAVLCFLAAAPAAAMAGDLRVELVGGPRDDEGRLVLTVPSARDIGLALRLTNTGDEPAEVVLSNYPAYLHAKLSIARIGPNGEKTPVEPYGDLYPLKDMKAPSDVTHRLAPGESVERSLDHLLVEGYFLETYTTAFRDRYFELRAEGYGALREPAEYEIVGTYAADADAKPVETVPLRAVVRWRFPWDDSARRTARAEVIQVGEVVQVKAEIVIPDDPGFHQIYAIEKPEATLRGSPKGTTIFLVYCPTQDSVTWRLEGHRIVYLVEGNKGVLYADEASVLEATEERVAEAKARIAFFDLLAAEPLTIDAATTKAVTRLVDSLTESPELERAALTALEAMGEAAVPALAAFVGDERKLADPNVSFENRAEGAFEGIRHYRPVTVGKAIDALLNQITGEILGSERGWRIYARYVAAGAR